MVDRREFLEIVAGAGATMAFTRSPFNFLHQAGGKLIQRPIPSTGEMLPVVSFGPQEENDVAEMKNILTILADHGGRVVDGLHGGGEGIAHTAATELGIQDGFFWTTGLSFPVLPGHNGPPLKLEPAAVNEGLGRQLGSLILPKIDAVMVSTLAADVTTQLAAVRQLKKEGRVRYIGVHHLAFPPGSDAPFGNLESIMRNEHVDFVGTDYSVGDRRVEEAILPLAMERKIAFLAYFPFDRARIFKRASTTPLPEWAGEFDATTWAQFFLKYVISHPGVTVARTGTTKAHHMLDNIGGGIGRLPDEAMRKRMVALVDALPPTPPPGPPKGGISAPQPMPQPQVTKEPDVVLSTASLDRYVGEYLYAATGQTMTFRRDADRLYGKQDNSPDRQLVARSETRFTGMGPMLIEFQLDAQSKVTGAIVEWGSKAKTRVLLTRR